MASSGPLTPRPKPQAFDHAHAGTVEKAGDERTRAAQCFQERLDLLASQDHRKTPGTLRRNKLPKPGKVDAEHRLV